MSRLFWFLYGVVCYGVFFAVFLYLVGFVADIGVPKSVSSGATPGLMPALLVDLALIGLFGVQHTIMARKGFKSWLKSLLPEVAERSTYVMATNLVLILTFLYWQPLPGMVWQTTDATAVMLLYAICALGWVLVLISTFLTNHFDLFGLRQVYLHLMRKTYAPVGFREILFYRWIRHPMMLGLLIAFWATPVMTASHLLFSLGMTLYIVIGIHFEERGLRAELGQPYQDYQARTHRLLPFY